MPPEPASLLLKRLLLMLRRPCRGGPPPCYCLVYDQMYDAEKAAVDAEKALQRLVPPCFSVVCDQCQHGVGHCLSMLRHVPGHTWPFVLEASVNEAAVKEVRVSCPALQGVQPC